MISSSSPSSHSAPLSSEEFRPESHRRRYSDEALLYLPKLLLLVDRNPYSPTYGSFDRSYWHYRTMDFPCGMSQEFSLALAMAWALPFPDNPYHQNTRIKELALAGLDFARHSAHPDGSCDDYFPYEQALGAGVFSLYALSETCLILGDQTESRIRFLSRRADWLLKYQETGRLTNHQALCALALYNVFLLTREERFRKGAEHRVELCRQWQHEEGWFQEYEGADPGYHSCTIDFLSKLWQKSQDEKLLALLGPAVRFAWHFMHPDGSYAGEYGSRNTYHFYPHGFEVMSPHFDEAAAIADHFTRVSLPRRTRYYNDDDRMCAHYLYDWMQAWRDFSTGAPRAPIGSRGPFRKYFPAAKLLVVHTPRYYAVAGLAKGGVLKVFTSEGAAYSDTGLIAREAGGRVLVPHLMDAEHQTEVDDALQTAHVRGRMSRRRVMLPTPLKQIIFRAVNLTLGRFAPNVLRALLQKKLITGKPRTEWKFRRTIQFRENEILLTDALERPPSAPPLESVHAGSDATSIYVANSNVYQASVLLPWRDLGHGFIRALNETGRAEQVHRVVFPDKDA